jgi:hypothetical protein
MKTVFQQFFSAESCLFNDRSSIISPESWPLIFTFFYFKKFLFTLIPKKFLFTLIPVLNPASEPEPYSGSGSAMAKSHGSCGSGSTTLVVDKDPNPFYLYGW